MIRVLISIVQALAFTEGDDEGDVDVTEEKSEEAPCATPTQQIDEEDEYHQKAPWRLALECTDLDAKGEMDRLTDDVTDSAKRMLASHVDHQRKPRKDHSRTNPT